MLKHTTPCPLSVRDTETFIAETNMPPPPECRVDQRILRYSSIEQSVHPFKRLLLDPCAATLDQYNQNDDNQHTGNNPNNRGTIHVKSSFAAK